MIGAIAGDIIGSTFEHENVKSTHFRLFRPGSRFTDDTVLTVALADSILSGEPYVARLKAYYRTYPRAGYGGNFHRWAQSDSQEPYGSFGNGSAMRVSPVGWAYDTLDDVLEQARRSAAVTHDHPEGIKGAQAVAAAVFLARTGSTREEIAEILSATLGYNFERSLDEIRPTYAFEVSCQQSVPEAITAFLQSDDYEDAVRKAISLGGDSDTIACIAGAIAHAYYGGVPPHIADQALALLDAPLRVVVGRFGEAYGCL